MQLYGGSLSGVNASRGGWLFYYFDFDMTVAMLIYIL